MITKDTAERIARAYCEIQAAEELIKIMNDPRHFGEVPDFRDAFGRLRGLQLGIPSGASGHRLMDVSPRLAEVIIEAHVSEKRAEIAALCELARDQLSQKSVAT